MAIIAPHYMRRLWNGALRVGLLLTATSLGLASAQAAEPHCSVQEGEGLRWSAPLVFLVEDSHDVQRALIPDWEHRSSWLELAFSSARGLQLRNRMPGVGLPISLFRVEIKILDREHREEGQVEKRYCMNLSLYPGQESGWFNEMQVDELPQDSKIQVRFLLSDF